MVVVYLLFFLRCILPFLLFPLIFSSNPALSLGLFCASPCPVFLRVSPRLSYLFFTATIPVFFFPHSLTGDFFSLFEAPFTFPCPPRGYWTALVALCHFLREFMLMSPFFPPLFAYDFQPFQSRWRTILTRVLGRMADTIRPFHCVKETKGGKTR